MRKNGMIGYNGMSSHQQAVKEAQQQRAEEKQEQQRVLTPVAELIFAEIDKLKMENTKRLLDVVSPDTPDDNLKATLLAIRMNRDDLVKLKGRFENILRHGKTDKDGDK